MDTNVIGEVSEDEYSDGDSDEEDVYLADLEWVTMSYFITLPSADVLFTCASSKCDCNLAL